MRFCSLFVLPCLAGLVPGGVFGTLLSAAAVRTAAATAVRAAAVAVAAAAASPAAAAVATAAAF